MEEELGLLKRNNTKRFEISTFASAPLTIRVLSTVERPQEQDESLFTWKYD